MGQSKLAIRAGEEIMCGSAELNQNLEWNIISTPFAMVVICMTEIGCASTSITHWSLK